jgi:outer membrane protein assembly factor BamB
MKSFNNEAMAVRVIWARRSASHMGDRFLVQGSRGFGLSLASLAEQLADLVRSAGSTVARLAGFLLLISSASAVVAAGPVLVGTQTIQAQVDSNAAGQAEAFKTTAVASGTVSSLSVYVDAGSTGITLVAGLYADNAGTPGALLTQGALSSPVGGSWNTINVPSANVVAGTAYWIAVLGPMNSGLLKFRDKSGGTRAETSSQKNLASLPASWTTGGVYSDSPMAAYASGSGSSQPIISVTPASIAFSYTMGGATPSAALLNVANTGGGTLSFTVSSNAPWLSVSPLSGSAPQSVQVTASVAGLAAGTYNGQVTVSSSGTQGSPAIIPVTLTVNAAPQPILSVTPASLAFSYTIGGTNPAPATLNVANTGTGTLSFTASSNATWLSVSPTSGSAPRNEQVTVAVAGLAAGTYSGQVTVTSSGAQGSPTVIPVTLTVTAAAPQPILSVTPSSVSFSYTLGGANPPPATLNVANTGTGTLSFTASSNASWLSLSPTSGSAPQSVQVTASVSGLAVGTYNAQATITASGSQGSPMTIPVTLTVGPAVSGSADWPMVNRDPARSGYAANDSIINATNVANLGLKWSASVDGKVVAQPLYASGVQISAQSRDVVIAATAANSLYALDANTGAQIWSRNFGADFGGCQPLGGSGIRSAPVIDRNSNRIYLIQDDGTLRTVSLATGSDVAPALPIIDLPATNKVRGGLNLFGNNLYIASGSGGCDAPPWRGRIFRVDVAGATPVLATTFDVIPSITGDNRGGGIWGYGGVAIDPATGNVFAATGADKNEAYTPYAVRMLSLSSNLTLQGSYEPPHPATYPCSGAPCDVDFGATPIVFQPDGCPTLVAAGNKSGGFYLLRATDLAVSGSPLQSLQLNPANDWLGSGGVGGVPAYWPGGRMLFVTDAGPGVTGIAGGIVAFSVLQAPACTLQVAWSAALPNLGYAMSSPTVAGGVVFVGEGASGRMHAFNATTGAELWNSGAIITGGTYAAPSVAGGKLFVGSWNGQNGPDTGTVRAFAPGTGPGPGPGPCSGPPPAILLGEQTLGSQVDSNSLGTVEAFSTIAGACGSVGSVSVYLDATSTAAKVTIGLYADSSGHPGSLLGQGTTAQPTAGAWNTIAISPVSVTQATKYWIAILGTQSGTPRYRDRKGGCSSELHAASGLSALPLVWSTGAVYDDCPISAYGNSTP